MLQPHFHASLICSLVQYAQRGLATHRKGTCTPPTTQAARHRTISRDRALDGHKLRCTRTATGATGPKEDPPLASGSPRHRSQCAARQPSSLFGPPVYTLQRHGQPGVGCFLRRGRATYQRCILSHISISSFLSILFLRCGSHSLTLKRTLCAAPVSWVRLEGLEVAVAAQKNDNRGSLPAPPLLLSFSGQGFITWDVRTLTIFLIMCPGCLC